jgi:protein-disulfide isomerase
MAKRPTRRQQQPQSRSLLRRALRGPTLLAAAIAGAIAVVAVIIVVSVVTQGGGSIDRLDGIPVEGRTRGSEDAPVVIWEFADFQCGHCKNFAETTAEQIEEEYVANNLVRMEFRIMAFMGDESVLAAEASLCAADQNKFWEYHDRLFEKQQGVNRNAFSLERLRRFAGDVELNQEEFDTCFNGRTHADKVQEETKAARDAGVDSTPSLFIMVNGSDDYEHMKNTSFGEIQDIIEDKLEEAAAAAAP